MAIQSFNDRDTKALWEGRRAKSIPADIQRRAIRKLQLIDAAVSINDLRVPPGNHLEALSGDLAGRHSIRVNKQWRVIFVWQDGNAYEVSITDYH